MGGFISTSNGNATCCRVRVSLVFLGGRDFPCGVRWRRVYGRTGWVYDDDVIGESNQEKQKQIMVKKKEFNDQEKEKEGEKEKENENEKIEKDEKNKNEERSKSEQAREKQREKVVHVNCKLHSLYGEKEAGAGL